MAASTGRSRARALLAANGSAELAYRRLPEARVTPEALSSACRRLGLQILVPEEPGFPLLLRHIPDPPLALFVQGPAAVLQEPSVAIVGARRCSRLGAGFAGVLAAGVVERGLSVVSGLALGIDAAAHRASLDGGRSIAVIGSGLGRPYPASNRRLAMQILDRGGALLSEYPPWMTARQHHFPERNRLISGLALGVVVVEAGDRSGSLITARMALEQGREVMAVPGPVTSPASRGCHRLLQQGAALVTSVSDLFEALGNAVPAAAGQAPRPPEAPPPRPELARILEAVEPVLTTLDEVVAACGLDAPSAAARLIELELGGFVEQVPGGYIRRPARSS